MEEIALPESNVQPQPEETAPDSTLPRWFSPPPRAQAPTTIEVPTRTQPSSPIPPVEISDDDRDDDDEMEAILLQQSSYNKHRNTTPPPSIMPMPEVAVSAELDPSSAPSNITPERPPLEPAASSDLQTTNADEPPNTHDNSWDAAQEMDPEAEEGGFANFMSQVQNRSVDTIRAEIDEELRVLHLQKKAAMRDSEDITQQMVGQIQMMLRLFGIPYITAPMEAEAQCAALVELGLVEGIITDDSDVFLFGGQRVFRNMFNQSKTVECFLQKDLSRELGLSRDDLVRLAFLLGSDYTEGPSWCRTCVGNGAFEGVPRRGWTAPVQRLVEKGAIWTRFR